MTKKSPGRPSKYTEEIADEICRRIARGETLLQLCRDEDMPARETVRGWVIDDKNGFSGMYARARMMLADHYADQITEISDDRTKDTISTETGEKANNEWMARSRLRVDTRKWLAAKFYPKIYGDRQKIEHEVAPSTKFEMKGPDDD